MKYKGDFLRSEHGSGRSGADDGQGGTHFEGSRRHRSGTCDGKTGNRAGNCKAGGLPGEVVKDGLLENEAYGYFTTVIVKE